MSAPIASAPRPSATTFTKQRFGSLFVAVACAAPLLLAAVIYWFGLYYAIETSNPLVRSDAWWFVQAWLVPLQDGTLTLADLWAKRHGNHAQPLTALLFLANAQWLGLDFGIETVLGLALATTYAAALLALARRYSAEHTTLHAAWVAAAIVCVLFSVNSAEKLSWSLVALFYLGHLLGLGLLWSAARQRAAPRPLLLGAAAFVVCALIDTTGVLWCAAAAGLMLLTRPENGARWPTRASSALAVLVAIGLYQLLYRWLIPPQSGPDSPGLVVAISAWVHAAGGAWQAVLPFGSAIAHPDRLTQLLGAGEHDWLVLVLAAVCLAGHAWLWSTALRREVNAGFAVACGLALFGYATIAGVLLQRVPEFGFGYLLQPRYGVFFDLLWIAPILGWACRPRQREPRAFRLGAASFLVLPCLMSGLWLDWAWTEIQWIRGWNNWIARDTWALLQDPATVPDNCNPQIEVCGWPLPVRERLLQALRAGPYNIASPQFRAAHGLDALVREVDAEQSAGPTATTPDR